MNYKAVYFRLVRKAKIECRIKTEDVYYERHHVIPEFMFRNRSRAKNVGHLPGNPNAKNNIILLSAKEHIVAHLLLYRMFMHTRYEHQCASSMLLMMHPFGKKNKSQLAYHRSMNISRKINSRLYSLSRKQAMTAISKSRTGTFPAKDILTGEPLGSISIDDLRVKSGQAVHVTHGLKFSERRLDLARRASAGTNNPLYSGISNQTILDEFIKLSIYMNEIPSVSFLRKVVIIKTGISFPKSFSKFRFNHGKDLIPLVEAQTGLKYDRCSRKFSKLNAYDYIL
jgi:hypothetical protein